MLDRCTLQLPRSRVNMQRNTNRRACHTVRLCHQIRMGNKIWDLLQHAPQDRRQRANTVTRRATFTVTVRETIGLATRKQSMSRRESTRTTIALTLPTVLRTAIIIRPRIWARYMENILKLLLRLTDLNPTRTARVDQHPVLLMGANNSGLPPDITLRHALHLRAIFTIQ